MEGYQIGKPIKLNLSHGLIETSRQTNQLRSPRHCHIQIPDLLSNSYYNVTLLKYKQANIMLSKEGRILTEVLVVEKRYGDRKIITKFARKYWPVASVNRLLRQIDLF